MLQIMRAEGPAKASGEAGAPKNITTGKLMLQAVVIGSNWLAAVHNSIVATATGKVSMPGTIPVQIKIPNIASRCVYV